MKCRITDDIDAKEVSFVQYVFDVDKLRDAFNLVFTSDLRF